MVDNILKENQAQQIEKIRQIIDENGIKSVDLKYCGLLGQWYHLTFAARRLEDVLLNGESFDGSSIPGMKAVESGDMVIMPDTESYYIDNSNGEPVLRILCYICDADTRIGIKKDPRSVAKRAFDYLNSTKIADEALWIPELEFYLFNTAEFYNDNYGANFKFSSYQDAKSVQYQPYLNGNIQNHRKGYHMDTPFDQHFAVRQKIVQTMEETGINIRYHHHEVGLAGQQEIETELLAFPKICDDVMVMKDIIRSTALQMGLSATFMPKPIYNEPGNGLHFHIMLKKNGENIFYTKGNYADLSDTAIHFIGGILKHGCSLTAFTNPSTNSYKRLLPGFEAPVKLFYGLANRSAAIRIPKYATTKETKRIEFRTGDATANPYLAMSALLMAGIDGIKHKTDPSDYDYGPYDENVYEWSEEKKAKLVSIPASLKDSLEALKADYDYLLAGDVFNNELIDAWIKEKTKEIEIVNSRPTPMEMQLYYNL